MSITEAGLRIVAKARAEARALEPEVVAKARWCPLCSTSHYYLADHLRTKHGWR